MEFEIDNKNIYNQEGILIARVNIGASYSSVTGTTELEQRSRIFYKLE